MNAEVVLSRAESIAEEAAAVAAAAQRRELSIACAESLTSGAIASALGRAPHSALWFAGGVVAYSETAKVEALGVHRGPVVTEQCALEMAAGVRRLMKADAAVAVTGVGGPGESEGHPAGTVMIAVSTPRADWAATHHFEGDPVAVVSRTTLHALVRLRELLDA